MSDYVIVRINEQLIPEFQINYDVNNSVAQFRNVSSWSQIKIELNQELILIISAVLVFSKEVKIPSKNEEVIKQSIPYALEEELSTDIENNHFAYIKSSENLFNVSVVAKEVMQQIIFQLENNKLNCKKLYSEIYTLPASKNILSILNINDYFITNNNNTGTTLKTGLLNSYIDKSKSKSVHIYSNKIQTFKNEIIVNKQVDTAFFQSKTLIENKAVNLFQGKYNQNIEKQNLISPWKKALGLGFVLLLSWLVINSYKLWDVSDKINKIKNKQQELLVQLVPNASQSEKNDPYSAIQSRIKYVQTNNTNSTGSGFIQSLLFVGQTLNQHKQIKIVSVRQRENKLEINVLAPNVNSLNQFQASLEQTVLARHIKTGTRNSTKDGISSVITMEKL